MGADIIQARSHHVSLQIIAHIQNQSLLLIPIPLSPKSNMLHGLGLESDPIKPRSNHVSMHKIDLKCKLLHEPPVALYIFAELVIHVFTYLLCYVCTYRLMY